MAVASSAQAYATFGGLLTGFAFSGLSFYITRKPGQETGSHKEHYRPEVKSIPAAVFLAMVSLGICSFLYANLGSVASTTPRAAIMALLPYGIVFALSVLSLFYTVTLMMLENLPAKDAARIAYWVVTVAGTVLVLRFLAGTVREAVMSRCPAPPGPLGPPTPPIACTLPGVLSSWGICLTLLAAASLSVIFTMKLQESEPRGVIGELTNHPALPPGFVFIATVVVTTTVSVHLSTRSSPYKPPEWLIYPGYAACILFVALFALACGRVVAPRAEVSVESLLQAVRLRRRAHDGSATHEAATHTPARSRSRPVRIILHALWIGALAGLLLIGPQRYLSLWVSLPAVGVFFVVQYSCRQRPGNGSRITGGMPVGRGTAPG
jgi:hypothetical protein